MSTSDGSPPASKPEPAADVGAKKHILFVGLPGAGKSTIARQLSETLRRPLLDFDTEIEQSFGKSVAEIFAEYGESHFRVAESDMSRLAVSSPPAILAPGGGWVANSPAVAHLQPVSRIIYLRVSPEGAIRRMGRGVVRRPLFAQGDAVETMRKLYDARRKYYEELADVVVETESLRRHQLTTAVLEAMSRVADTDIER